MKQALFIGAIASVLTINSVLATTSTVTSRDYVDAQDALKQNKIPATGTNASTPGDTVVTYTSTAGTIGERWICDAEAYDDDDCDDTALVTTNVISSVLDYVDAQINLPETTVTYKTCTEWSGTPHTDANCLLWNLSDKDVYGRCSGDADCPDSNCINNPDGEYGYCQSSTGICACGGGR